MKYTKIFDVHDGLKKKGKYILIFCLILFSFILPLVEAKTSFEWVNETFDLMKSGKYDEAIKASDEALKIDPQYEYAWISKGTALYSLKRYDEAIKAFDEALKINPRNKYAWFYKGMILSDLKMYDIAVKAFVSIAVKFS
jgi:tetratricopeptide (TPR) repeat protein